MGAGNKDIYKRQVLEVRALFGDKPIVEAPADFVVYASAEDIAQGVPGDPNNCMFSLACKRAFGSQGVLFYPTVAYVEMLDPNDNSRRIVMRFRLGKEMRERLEKFDRDHDKGGPAEATFILKRISSQQALGANRRRQKAYRKAIAAGERVPNKNRSLAAKRGHETRRNTQLLGIRSGVGGVHTTP